MSMSLGDIAATPTAPTVSQILAEAAQQADKGPFVALRLAALGTLDPLPIIALITPEHLLAEGAALIVLAGLVAPDVEAPQFPDPEWTAGEAAEATGRAHRTVSAWAASHTPRELAHLFEAAADRATLWERQ